MARISMTVRAFTTLMRTISRNVLPQRFNIDDMRPCPGCDGALVVDVVLARRSVLSIFKGTGSHVPAGADGKADCAVVWVVCESCEFALDLSAGDAS